MDDVRRDFLGLAHGTMPAAVKTALESCTNVFKQMYRSHKHAKPYIDGSYQLG